MEPNFVQRHRQNAALIAEVNRALLHLPEMSADEEAIEKIEKIEAELPMAAGAVFAAARRDALAAGFSVFQSEDGVIIEVFPDGRREERKRIEPPTRVEPGTKRRLSWASSDSSE